MCGTSYDESADVVPLVGSIVGLGIGLVPGVIAFALSAVTIAISMATSNGAWRSRLAVRRLASMRRGRDRL